MKRFFIIIAALAFVLIAFQHTSFAISSDKVPESDSIAQSFVLWVDGDLDNDGTPNGLDQDVDGDGFDNPDDNCYKKANPGQEDDDNDGVGDVCDNCPDVANADQDKTVCEEVEVEDTVEEVTEEYQDEETETGLDISMLDYGYDEGGGCSLLPRSFTAAHSFGFILILVGFLQIARLCRKK